LENDLIFLLIILKSSLFKFLVFGIILKFVSLDASGWTDTKNNFFYLFESGFGCHCDATWATW